MSEDAGMAPEAARIEVPYRVRFDECGPDGVARTSTLLRYAQDVAWIHSERLGFGREWYAERAMAWVVRAAELAILEPVALGVTLTVSTEVVGSRRVWVRRRTEARLPDGTLAMWGHTDWVIIDARGLPSRIPPELTARFVVPPRTFEPGRVPLPPTPADARMTGADVRRRDLDPMSHVNNAAYLDYLEEALLDAGEAAVAAIAALPRTVRIEYLAPAAPGAHLSSAAWRDDLDGLAGWAWRLVDPDEREVARGRVLVGA
jgi:acyl-CoA thioesterase FadM